MRFDLVSVGGGPDTAVIRLHPRLTVIGGVGVADRVGMVDLLVGALTGEATDAAGARLVDEAGFGVVGSSESGRWDWQTDDGTAWVSPLSLLGIDAVTARELMVLMAEHLLIAPAELDENASPELVAARASLDALEAELADALNVKVRADELHCRMAAIEEQLRTVHATVARRRRDALVARFDAVRLEAAILRDGDNSADTDRRVIEAAPKVVDLAERWRQACQAAKVERARFGDRERLDPRTLAEALSSPDRVPPDLDALAALYEAAEAQRALLADRLTALVARALPSPSHPAIVRLASANQDEVWAAARAAVEAEAKVEEQSLVFGGLEAEGVAAPAAADLEDAHHALEVAQRDVAQKLPIAGLVALGGLLTLILGLVSTPLLIALGLLTMIFAGAWGVAVPMKEARRCAAAENDALGRAGVPSYMTFHLRRLDVHLSPAATEPLEVAALEYRRALATWRRLGGEVSPSEALGFEPEARAYAATLAGAHGVADEVARLREQLATEAEPGVARARARLVDACSPFGIRDPQLAVELVRHQAKMSAEARLQAALEDAERLEAASRHQLDTMLSALGFRGDGDLDRQLARFEQARNDGVAREAARKAARPLDEVDAELAQLEELLAGDWAEVPLLGIEDPAVVEEVARLRDEQREAVAAYDATYRLVPDIERLSDRRAALERRVAVLVGERRTLLPDDFDDALLGRLTTARAVGPRSESMPVVLVDPFERLHGDRKYDLLDRVERLSGSVQMVYLTDDVDVLLWARRRAPDGAVSLLEPVGAA